MDQPTALGYNLTEAHKPMFCSAAVAFSASRAMAAISGLAVDMFRAVSGSTATEALRSLGRFSAMIGAPPSLYVYL